MGVILEQQGTTACSFSIQVQGDMQIILLRCLLFSSPVEHIQRFKSSIERGLLWSVLYGRQLMSTSCITGGSLQLSLV